MKHSLEPLIDALKTARRDQAQSQRALSERTGIPQSRLSLIESGAVDLRVSTLLRIARSLDLEVMLVPRRSVPLVKALTRGGGSPAEQQPLYRLDDRDE